MHWLTDSANALLRGGPARLPVWRIRLQLIALLTRYFSQSRRVMNRTKLQALVYHILPSTTAVFSYAIGSRKLSANEQSLENGHRGKRWCSNTSKFATNNSNKTRHVIYSDQQSLHQHKLNHKHLKRDRTLLSFFNRGVCVSCLRACFGARLLLQSY